MHKVLIIDDEGIIRDCCLRSLNGRGYEVHTADSGPEGLQMIEEDTYDVVFLDLIMPGMDGLEVARSIRKLPDAPKVVFISGYTDDEFKQKARETGAELFIEKPFTPSDLVEAIEYVKGV